MAITYKPLLRNKRQAVNVYIDDFKWIGRIMHEVNAEGWRFYPANKMEQSSDKFLTIEGCKIFIQKQFAAKLTTFESN